MLDRFLRASDSGRARNRSPRRRLFQLETLESRTLLSGAEIAVFDGATELVSGSTLAIDLGTTTQGAATIERTFRLFNIGDETLTLGPLGVPAGFSIVEGLYQSVAVRGSDSFTIRLDTATAGFKSGQVSFLNNDDDENPFTFTISGTVLAGGPEISVALGSSAIANGSATPIDFGAVIQGQAGTRLTFLVSNDGSQPLTLGPVQVPAGFVVTEGLNSVLAPRTSDTFSVQLLSVGLGARTGNIRIDNNDADENPFTFAVRGSVLASGVPDIHLSMGVTDIPNGAVAAIDFGSVFQGQSGPTRTFTVRNDGTETLAVSAITVPDGFTLTQGIATSLIARASATFTVRLDSTTLGTPTGEIVVTSNDPDESPFRFTVAGSVLPDEPEIAVIRVDQVEILDGVGPETVLPPVAVGETAFYEFDVINIGSRPLVITDLVAPAGFRIIRSLPPSLDSKKVALFQVAVDSSTPGDKVGDVLIFTNDSDESPFAVPMRASVVAAAPEITVRDGRANIAAGSRLELVVERNATLKRTFTVRNDGTAPLHLTGLTLPAAYKLLNGLDGTIRPGGSDSFTVQFDASVSGSFGGTVSIANDDPDENPFEFSIAALAGTVPQIVVLDGDTPFVSGSGAVVDFGTVVRRQTGPIRTFTIRNDGTGDLNIRRIALPDGFKLISRPRQRLSSRGSDTFTVRLNTKTIGVMTGFLTIESDDPERPVFTIAIQGTVTA